MGSRGGGAASGDPVPSHAQTKSAFYIWWRWSRCPHQPHQNRRGSLRQLAMGLCPGIIARVPLLCCYDYCQGVGLQFYHSNVIEHHPSACVCGRGDTM
jgi:hypothetical protein